ncbi:MAG TPA: DNA polymerase ligase N-terminal domain-containing protein [Solirubrobacterales bacterium]|nr:DNA polymerase ligase N-terminal domain-containing protein [Solirubrobacterales bacterium]
MGSDPPTRAIRARLEAPDAGAGFAEGVVRRAHELGLLGWVRREGDVVSAHVEGESAAVDRLIELLEADSGSTATVEAVKVEGHEQFAIRGVIAGAFVVREHQARAHHFDFRLEVGGAMRSWAVPKGPSLDPAVKRMAIATDDHDPAGNDVEGAIGEGHAIVWDRGGYEQGGRVPWPEALERGHAVFVLHGEKLRGGFALQRTGGGPSPRWLLVKRVDEEARPGTDVVAEHPCSVISGRTLDEVG